MIMDEISYEDIHQQYYNNIVLYKGKPVYVVLVDADKNVTILDLLTQKKDIVPFSFETFKPPAIRLGMINCAQTVVYTSRQPFRKMQVGINSGNMIVSKAMPEQDEDFQYIAQKNVRRLTDKAIAACLMGDYPSFDKALKTAREVAGGGVAFDRQFAVTHKGSIIYKQQIVGSIKKSGKTVEDIVFNEGYEYLAILIGDNCEKTLRTSRA